MECKLFRVVTDTEYRNLKDLEKIDSLKHSKNIEKKDINDVADKHKISYTCFKGCCKIPCCCKDCCINEMQCMLHRITHPDLFDPKLHRRTIRSARKICKDSSFFGKNKMYIVNYSEIPKSCNPCGKDLVHHDAYHLVYHHNCKFCRFNKFKYRAESEKEFHKIIKEEEKYYATVCPYCDNNFSENHLETNIFNMHMKKFYSNAMTVIKLSLQTMQWFIMKM